MMMITMTTVISWYGFRLFCSVWGLMLSTRNMRGNYCCCCCCHYCYCCYSLYTVSV